MMKTCSICKQELALELFGKNKATKDGLNYSCKQCARKRSRENHLKRSQDPEKHKKHNERIKRRAQARKAYIVHRVFGGHCYDCGEAYPDCVFDFHHEGDEKTHNPSQLIGRNQMEAAFKELENCVMLCANCHRMRHFHNKDIDATSD